MGFFRRLFASLTQVECDLRGQGYIVVYGGATSLLVPVGVQEQPKTGDCRVTIHGLIFAAVEP